MTSLTDSASASSDELKDPHSVFQSRIWSPWLTMLWSGIIFFLFAIAQLVGTAVAALRVMSPEQMKELFMGGDSESMERALYELGLIWPAALTSAIIGSLFIFLVIKMKRGLSIRDYLNLRNVKPAVWGIWLGITLAVGALLEYAVSLDSDLQTPFMKDVVSNTGSIPMLILSVGVLAPIFEELFFRGFVFKGLERSILGAHGAIWVTSIVFALIHLQYSPGVMLLIIPMGLLLGYSRHYSGSLLVPIAIHVLNNTVAIFLTMDELHRGFSF